MPYQLITAQARSKAIEAVWEEVDLSQTDINTIYSSYRRVILTLTHTVQAGTFYLDMETARTVVGVYTGVRKLGDWLQSLGTRSLPTMIQPPSFKTYPARYTDVWRAGYTVRPVDGTRHPDAQLPERAKNDLLLNRGDVDFRVNGNYCLTTVNGYFHRCAGTENGLVIVDGARTGFTGKDNHVGLMSFRDVGAVTSIPINASMVYKQYPDQRYADYAMIKSPVNLENKVVLISIGGYLHVLDRAYAVTGPYSIRINTDRLHLLDRLYQSLGQIELSSLGLTPAAKNAQQFAVSDVFSDRAIRAYLSLPQSFLIVMDKTDLYVRRHVVENTRLPGRYITNMPLDQFPLISAYGRMYDYAPFPQEGLCVLATNPIHRYHRNYNSIMWPAEQSVDPTSYSSDPWSFADAYLLEIGRLA